MDSDSSLNNENMEPPQNTNKNVIIRTVLGVFQILTGFLAHSFAFVADGMNTLLSVPGTLCVRTGKTIIGYLSVFVFSAVAIWLALATFFEMSATIDYLSSFVRLWVLPCIAVSIVVKAIMLYLVKEKAEASKLKFDLFVSAVVFVSVICSYWFSFYFEPVIAMALSIYMFAYSVEEGKRFYHMKKVREIETILEESEKQ